MAVTERIANTFSHNLTSIFHLIMVPFGNWGNLNFNVLKCINIFLQCWAFGVLFEKFFLILMLQRYPFYWLYFVNVLVFILKAFDYPKFTFLAYYEIEIHFIFSRIYTQWLQNQLLGCILSLMLSQQPLLCIKFLLYTDHFPSFHPVPLVKLSISWTNSIYLFKPKSVIITIAL